MLRFTNSKTNGFVGRNRLLIHIFMVRCLNLRGKCKVPLRPVNQARIGDANPKSH